MATTRRIKRCDKCGLIHKAKTCPELTGKLEQKWIEWSKQYAHFKEKYPSYTKR